MKPSLVFTKSEFPALLREQEVYACFSSSDFLGFSKDKAVLQAFRDGLNREKELGAGNISFNGISSNQVQLENKFKNFKANEASLLFSSFEELLLNFIFSLQKNLTPIFLSQNLSRKVLKIFSLSKLEPKYFDSSKPGELEKMLLETSLKPLTEGSEALKSKKPVILLESVSSLNGEIAPLRAYNKLSEKFLADLVVDESEAAGILGLIGSGGIENSALLEHKISSIIDCSKALSFKAACACAKLEFLENYFSSEDRLSLSSPLIYGLEETLNLVQIETKKRQKLKANSLLLREGLLSMGHKVSGDPGIPIIFLEIENKKILSEFYKGLLERKILVCKEESGIKILLTALHTAPLIANLLQVVEDISKQLGLVRN